MRTIRLLLSLPLLAATLAGCGGGNTSGTPATGRASITVTWPDRTRLIPLACNSIRITLTDGGTTLANRLIERPTDSSTSTITFQNLPAVLLTVIATAYPDEAGVQTAQATATANVAVQPGQVTPLDITMASTIDRLEVPNDLNPVYTGQTIPLTMTVRDKSGAVVVTWPGKIQWSSSNPAVARVDASGTVTTLAGGTAQITVTEGESGKSATVPIAVVAGPFPNPGIYVTDPASNRIVRIDDMTGAGWTAFNIGATGPNQANQIAVSGAGPLFLTTTSGLLQRRDDMTGANKITANSLVGQALYVAADHWLYVTEGQHIYRTDDVNSANRTIYGSSGSGIGKFYGASGIAVDSRGRIYIADTGNQRIVRMDDMTGANWTAFDVRPKAAPGFNGPFRLALDSRDRIYFLDVNNHQVVRIDDMTGAGWTAFGAYGFHTGHFAFPNAIALDRQDRIYVADYRNHRIVRMDDMTGAGWTTFGSPDPGIGYFAGPTGIWVR